MRRAAFDRLSFELFHGYTDKRRVVSFGWRYDFYSTTFRSAREG